jgi:hypothetical protein
MREQCLTFYISFWMNTIDATPHVSVGDGATLFSQHYLFVKFSLRTNTRKMAVTACRFVAIAMAIRSRQWSRKRLRSSRFSANRE